MKGKKTTARDVFFYLLMIVTLYVGVISFLTVLFQFINIVLPDPLDYYSSAIDALRGGISALIVVWPVYIFMSWLIEKDMKQDSSKRTIWVRRWLLYLTLFIAALTIIIDLITLINGFLGGELTGRFLLKTLAVLVVAGATFGYYLWALRQDGKPSSQLPKILAWVTSIVAVVAIVAALFAVGTPSQQRALRFDEERVFDLELLQSEVANHWRQKNLLPQDLSELSTGLGPFDAPLDPETEQPYIYRPTGNLSFELCATFVLPSEDIRSPLRSK